MTYSDLGIDLAFVLAKDDQVRDLWHVSLTSYDRDARGQKRVSETNLLVVRPGCAACTRLVGRLLLGVGHGDGDEWDVVMWDLGMVVEEGSREGGQSVCFMLFHGVRVGNYPQLTVTSTFLGTWLPY
jgi:hypothetical protein